MVAFSKPNSQWAKADIWFDAVKVWCNRATKELKKIQDRNVNRSVEPSNSTDSSAWHQAVDGCEEAGIYN